MLAAHALPVPSGLSLLQSPCTALLGWMRLGGLPRGAAGPHTACGWGAALGQGELLQAGLAGALLLAKPRLGWG